MNDAKNSAVRIDVPNLTLRDFRLKDLMQYQRLRNDPKMYCFYNDDDSSVHRAGQLLDMFIEQANQVARTKFQFPLESDRQLVGTCGIRPFYR